MDAIEGDHRKQMKATTGKQSLCVFSYLWLLDYFLQGEREIMNVYMKIEEQTSSSGFEALSKSLTWHAMPWHDMTRAM